MSKGKVIGSVAAAILVPSAVVAAAVFILPYFDISASNTLYYFGNGTSISEDGTISLGKEDILGYSSKYSDTMTGYFKAQLDENETYIYNAVMYASENGYSDIFLPEDVFGGGSFDKAAYLAKKALLRPLNEPNKDEYYAGLEKELLDGINATGIGPQGFGGRTTALGLAIETMPTHVAGLPVAVNISCHATRRASAEL